MKRERLKTVVYAKWHRHRYEDHGDHIGYICYMDHKSAGALECAGDTRGAVRMIWLVPGDYECPLCEQPPQHLKCADWGLPEDAD